MFFYNLNKTLSSAFSSSPVFKSSVNFRFNLPTNFLLFPFWEAFLCCDVILVAAAYVVLL